MVVIFAESENSVSLRKVVAIGIKGAILRQEDSHAVVAAHRDNLNILERHHNSWLLLQKAKTLWVKLRVIFGS